MVIKNPLGGDPIRNLRGEPRPCAKTLLGNVELGFDTGVSYSAPQMALSYPGHLSAASERQRCVMNTKPKWERESCYRPWVVKGIENRIGQGKISSVF